MNSRERMLTAIGGKRPDRVPLSLMIFAALRGRTADWRDFIETSVGLGTDVTVNLADIHPESPAEHVDALGVPIHFHAEVRVREWREPAGDGPYPVLHKEYVTPAGTLSVAVGQAEDWPYGDHVPLMDDYIEPRATTFPVRGEEDLAALEYLLPPADDDTIRRCREVWAPARQLAADRGLLLAGGRGVGWDSAAWLVGLTNALLASRERPEFLEAYLSVIEAWNRGRMEIILDQGVDLFIRRGWYEGTSFWSPSLFRRFLLPGLKREAALAHEAGARFGYIMTVGSLQFVDMLLEAGVDVVLGVEDVQDRGMDFTALKRAVAGRMGLWGGVNGFVTIEQGSDDEIRQATARALETLGPDGFILSPVDNVRDTSAETWRKTMLFVDTYRRVVGA
ncbi:MAG: hypothetical protein JXL80_14000 [Planctomycetes bacterium]|nr:hypothetical protein [Planctomycetota bacterium]